MVSSFVVRTDWLGGDVVVWGEQYISGTSGDLKKTLTEQHWETPSLAFLDPLGKPFLTIAKNKTRNATTNEWSPEDVATREYTDIEGNRTRIIDALGRESLQYQYDMVQRPLRTHSIDGGTRWMLAAYDGQPLAQWDSLGRILLHTHDQLRRPRHMQLLAGVPPHPLDNGNVTMPTYSTTAVVLTNHNYWDYADMDTGTARPEAMEANGIGRPKRVFDTAGRLAMESYDLMGQPLRQSRTFAVDYIQMPYWNRDGNLESETFTTHCQYDALGRIRQCTFPEGEVLTYVYQPTGQVETVKDDSENPFLKLARYDAKGQRQRVRHGNDLTTDYSYDPLTFRLTELKTYRRDQETTPLQHLQYEYDAVGNIVKKKNLKQPGTFFGGSWTSSDSLFLYDPMYRLVEATGREHAGNVSSTTSEDVFEQLPFLEQVSANASLAFRNYTETYSYDKVGNILHLDHEGGSTGSFSRHYLYGQGNNHLLDTVFGATPTGNTYTHDAHGNCTQMPGLSAMGWDVLGRLSHTARQVVSSGLPETTWYQYDLQGNRVRKITTQEISGTWVGTLPTLYRKNCRYYVGDLELYRTYTSGGAVNKETFSLHISDETGRFALLENDGTTVRTRYQHTDHLGSSHLETDDSG